MYYCMFFFCLKTSFRQCFGAGAALCKGNMEKNLLLRDFKFFMLDFEAILCHVHTDRLTDREAHEEYYCVCGKQASSMLLNLIVRYL